MRIVPALVVAAGTVLAAVSAQAQTVIGPLRWQLQPYGSAVNITFTQRGDQYEMTGFEEVCAGTLRRWPLTGHAVFQPDGRLMMGFTSINDQGRGLHTRAVIQLPNLDGFYADNAGNGLSGGPTAAFVFTSAPVCPGGPRTNPSSPDAADTAALAAELAELRARLALLERKQ